MLLRNLTKMKRKQKHVLVERGRFPLQLLASYMKLLLPGLPESSEEKSANACNSSDHSSVLITDANNKEVDVVDDIMTSVGSPTIFSLLRFESEQIRRRSTLGNGSTPVTRNEKVQKEQKEDRNMISNQTRLSEMKLSPSSMLKATSLTASDPSSITSMSSSSVSVSSLNPGISITKPRQKLSTADDDVLQFEMEDRSDGVDYEVDESSNKNTVSSPQSVDSFLPLMN